MKKQSKDWEDIKINGRRTDKIFFESSLLQSISDKIDFLKEESFELLNELDSNNYRQQIDEFDLDEFSEEALYQISEIADNFSELRSEFINSDDLPEFIKEPSRNAKLALNRDFVYVRKAKRKLDRLESDELVDSYKTNIRVIELCNKAIDVNYKNWRAYYYKAQALINLEKYEDAISALIKTLALNEENMDAWFDLANAYMLDKNYAKSVEVYDSILKRNDKSFEALLGKARAYFEAGDYKNADEFFKKANSIKFLDEEDKEKWKSIQKDD